MEKYRVSESLEIQSPMEYNGELCPDRFKENHHVITTGQLKKGFLINSSMRHFLEKFDSFKTLDEVVSELALDLGTDKCSLFEYCEPIFKILKKKSFLVSQNNIENQKPRVPLFEAGDTLGCYRILSLISNKKNVDLYRVRKVGGVQPYVIKLLNSHKTENTRHYNKELAQFKHEYGLLCKGKTVDSLCKAYHFDLVEDKYAYIVMECIEGESLPRFLRHQINFPENDAYTLAHKILIEFTHLHDSKIIHGDIHPSNIMVKNSQEVKIIDLGLAIHEDHALKEAVKKGGVMYYMPPERINTSSLNKFSKHPDYYSDVYQLGLVLYFIFFRTEPFQGFIWEDLAASIINNPIVFPKQTMWQSELNPDLMKLIERCVDKNPETRFKNTEDILIHFENQVLSGKERKYYA
ncbi:serine/threonine-protein kinase [Lunatibacter salilacus]|uniref:serine/threonine-protein kinase n=1 Tax=Lunatibacter salilacus TaxID=2483804 RepID=UPI00131B1098|nr:serine/threonine-protein kinase [Lunatibacter salilacus]